MLCGKLAVMRAPMFNRFSFDPLAVFDAGRCYAEASIRRRHVFQALVIALVVLVLDEHLDLGFKVPGEIIIL